MQFEIPLASEEETRLLAEDLAAILRVGDVVALDGDLGAGKTTLARYLLRALADDSEMEVPSPTFTIAQSYSAGRLVMHHYDFYRLNAPDEVDEIGFHAALEDGAALVEWPQRAAGEIPEDALWLTLEAAGDSARTARLTTRRPEKWRERLARTLAIRAFLAESGCRDAWRRHLTGDASSRSYERIRHNGMVRILMNAPASADGPPIRNGLPYSRLAHLAESVGPFVAIARGLRDRGYSAPEIYACDTDQGLLLLEDLGAGPMVSGDAPIAERYAIAVDLLADMHATAWPADTPLPDGFRYRLPAYDAQAFLIEVELYPDWYVPHATDRAASPDAKSEFIELWRRLIESLEDESVWVLRDFHSPNLIWLDGRDGVRRIGLIDFQDALIGPTAYDVASLCQDARVTVDEALETSLVARYCAARSAVDAGFEGESFRRDYAVLAAQRATKILGIFARLNDRDGKPHYLRHIPRLSAYLERCLAHPALADIKLWYQTHAPDRNF